MKHYGCTKYDSSIKLAQLLSTNQILFAKAFKEKPSINQKEEQDHLVGLRNSQNLETGS